MTSGEMTLMFENVVVEDSNSSSTKAFRDVSIEVVGKDIYIGSNYKVKWKHVVSLTCKNDVDEADDDNSKDKSRSWQRYRDVDYERAGFELVCSRDTKKKTKRRGTSPQPFDAGESDKTDDLRTFSVRFPIPPDGHRFVAPLWEAFRKTLEAGYRKEDRKRQKKKERERAEREEELQEEQERRFQSSLSRSRPRTYSKRPYDFMRKNAANIANNAEKWTDDEEEAETTPKLVPVDESTEKNDVPNDGCSVGDDESENEFRNDSEEENIHSDNKVGNDDAVGAVEEGDLGTSGESPKTFNDDDQSTVSKTTELDSADEEDSVGNRRASKSLSSLSSKRKRLKRRAPVLEDSEDEDENLFQSTTTGMTTPGKTVQRVVTPGMSKSNRNSYATETAGRFVEDEGGDKEGSEQEKEQDRADESDDEPVKSNKKINSFFQPRSKINTTLKNDKIQPTKGNVNDDNENKDAPESVTMKVSDKEGTKQMKSSFFAPRTKIALAREKARSPIRSLSPKKKRRTPTTTKSVLDNDHSDSDDAPTVRAGSGASAVSDDIVEQHILTPSRSKSSATRSPKQRNAHFDIVRMSGSKVHDGRSIEEEDPIEDVDSSQSPSVRPSSSFLKRSRSKLAGGRLPSSKKRRRLRTYGSSALEALEFADAKTRNTLSPVPRSRLNGDVRSASKVSDAGRSPIQPLQLSQQVEKAETEYTNKWRGFRNDGNSCYVNSSLQQLFSVPTFMQAISRCKEGHELASTLSSLYEDHLGKGVKEGAVSKDSSCSAQSVKKVMDRLTDRFHGWQQRDAHEFLGELIDQIHEELSPSSKGEGDIESEENRNEEMPKMPQEKNEKNKVEPTDEYFRWNVQVCLKCKSCGYSRSKVEMYRYLSIDIGHDNADPLDSDFVKPTVDSCLAKFFQSEDREVSCEKCKVGKIATQTMKVISVPKVILLHLKRFIVAERSIEGSEDTELVFKKNRIPVELTTNLSLNKLLTNQSDQSAETVSALPSDKYRLKSIVHHIGNTADSGHYTTDALRADPENGKDQWVSFDDGVAVEESLERVVNPTKNQKTAYMLLYSIE